MQHEDQLLDDFNFDDQQESQVQLITASTGKRLANNIIDGIVIQLLAVGGQIGMDLLDSTAASLFIGLLVQFGYYVLFESLNEGKTLGKMVTGTRVVTDYGFKADGGAIALRSLCRFVPFNAISIFFNDDHIMWHDKWTSTLVIDERMSNLPD